MSAQSSFASSAPPPARLLAPEEITKRAGEVDTIAQRIEALGADMEAKVERIDSRYGQDAHHAEETKIRTEFDNDTAPLVARLATLRAELEAQAPNYSREAVVARATFADTADEGRNVSLGLFWFARLPSEPPSGLVEIARKAATEYNLALAAAATNEAERRGLAGDLLAGVRDFLAAIPTPPGDVAALGAVHAGILAADLAEIRAEELSTGSTRSDRRLEVAFAARARSTPPKAKAGADAEFAADLAAGAA